MLQLGEVGVDLDLLVMGGNVETFNLYGKQRGNELFQKIANLHTGQYTFGTEFWTAIRIEPVSTTLTKFLIKAELFGCFKPGTVRLLVP